MRSRARSLALAAILAAGAGPVLAQASNSAALVRVQQLEEEIRRLNGRIEQLEHRLDMIARDGGTRIGDIEARLFEMDGGDPSLLGEAKPLGALETGPASVNSGPVVAVSEQAAFDAGVQLVRGGDPAGGRARLQDFRRAYPDSPLQGHALHWIGESFYLSHDYRAAAGAYFDNVEQRPQGPMAAESLIGLALALEKLGEFEAACHSLSEAPRRNPDDAQNIARARSEAERLGCPL